MAKKTTTAARKGPAARKGTKAAAPAAAARKKTAAGATRGKNVGDVLGISRARVPADVPRATTDRARGRPKGVELTPPTRRRVRPAGVVGGVRGRGR